MEGKQPSPPGQTVLGKIGLGAELGWLVLACAGLCWRCLRQQKYQALTDQQ